MSRKLRNFCLDDELWKRRCLGDSPWYHLLQSRRRALSRAPLKSADGASQTTLLLAPAGAGIHESASRSRRRHLEHAPRHRRWQERQDMANWDPTYPGEQVSWFNEYQQRSGPVCVNWLQTPRMQQWSRRHDLVEARGVAMYSPYGGNDGLGTMLAVSPLDDGSVCLWDVRGTRGRRGAIVARSKLDMLTLDGPGSQKGQRSPKVDTGIIECVSVNNNDHRAFFAVKSCEYHERRIGESKDHWYCSLPFMLDLVEVDLNRLEVVSRESFKRSITALSTVHDGVPLTVGTSLGIHLQDFRARARAPHDVVERLDASPRDDADVLKAVFDPKPLPPYAALYQPTPTISILHLPRTESPDIVSDDIYVSGLSSNILHYDRRKFPSIVGTIHSGAQIKSLTSLPCPFSTHDAELRRRGELSAKHVARMKSTGQGQTLIAGGGYKTRGSLEIYGLSTAAESAGQEMLHNSAMKNRTAASATILSVTNHGTKIVFSDGTGLLKWFERDGLTECRRVKIGHSDAEEPSSLFASMPATGDLARKVLSTRPREGQERANDDNILFWTGEKLGMVSFTTPLFKAKDFEVADSEAATEDGERKRVYKDGMRKALAWQADEVRFMGTSGMGMA